MRILFVVPNVPSCIRPRPLNFIRRLSQAHEVSVVCLASNDADERFLTDLRQHCHDLQMFRLSRWRALWNCLRALFSLTPLRCGYFYSPDMRDHIKKMVESNHVDLVHAEHLKSVAMVKDAMGKVPALFDAVDCLSMLELRRQRVTKNPLVKVFSWTESTKLGRYEARVAQSFNRVAISSPVDRDAYPVPHTLREKVDVIPNGVDLEHFGFRQFEAQRDLLIFCAKLDYFPNTDAALHFVGSVWPILRSRRPDLQLDIVGSRPPGSVRRLHGQNKIRVIPSVPDMRPHLARAWVALCPIRIRAGIQNKILEAMALGVPVVATSICLPGLQVEPGKHLLIADHPEQFASAIELLLDNSTLREKLIAAGREYVERWHAWSESAETLSDSYETAVANFNAENARANPRRGISSVA